MQIILPKDGGFCPGVKNAVDTALYNKNNNVCVLGELVHNKQVIDMLNDNGIETISDISLHNGRTVIIRTHGISKELYNYANINHIPLIDCTCPFVKKIQDKVNKYYRLGYKIVIIGKADHPEVIGINGWCNNTALISENPDEINSLPDKKICIVVQTTYSEQKFDEINKKIKTLSEKKVEFFKTICYTTIKRQSKVLKLSKNCDAIIVIGGANSSNTNKLYTLAKSNCPNVFMIHDPKLFDVDKIKKFMKVGIVLGASTPREQAQEVIQKMEKVTEVNITETNETKYTMDEAMKKLDKKPATFKPGQVITVTIVAAQEDGLAVSIPNAKKEIILDKDELILPYVKAYYEDKIDQTIRVMVTGLSPLVLSEKAMVKILKEEAEIKEIADGKIFEAEIKSTNKGGLIGKYGSYEVFVPSSQIRIGFVKDLDKYVGKTLRLKAEKVESRRKQIVASQRVILEAEKAERDAIKAEKTAAFFNSIQVNDIVIGTPVRFADFGAFVSVNGFDCLAHISDLSWTGCTNPADVLELNKEYEFKILKIDIEKQKVAIGYKQIQPKPWELVDSKYAVGDTVHGKVVRIVNFGAFVEVEKGIDGLVHISQISNKWLENPLSELEVGQEIDAKILDINSEKEKMTLSIKALLPEEPKPVKEVKVEKEEVKEEEPELKEWIDNDSSSVSIAEMIGNIEE